MGDRQTSVDLSTNNEPTRFGVVKSSIPSMSKGGRNTQRARNVGCAGAARANALSGIGISIDFKVLCVYPLMLVIFTKPNTFPTSGQMHQ